MSPVKLNRSWKRQVICREMIVVISELVINDILSNRFVSFCLFFSTRSWQLHGTININKNFTALCVRLTTQNKQIREATFKNSSRNIEPLKYKCTYE